MNEKNMLTSPSRVELRALLQSWDLSPQAVAVLEKEPEIVEALVQARYAPPFPSDYLPQQYEVRFEDVTHIFLKRGKAPFIQNCSPDYSPAFVEYCFDNQTALFAVDGEIIVDRTQNLDTNAIVSSFE